jgi:hypothetical protein
VPPEAMHRSGVAGIVVGVVVVAVVVLVVEVSTECFCLRLVERIALKSNAQVGSCCCSTCCSSKGWNAPSGQRTGM